MRMRYTILPLALSLGASATITKRGDHLLQFSAKGKAHGTLGQLPDGQIRIGGGYSPSHFKIHDGTMKDGKGRGCIETQPEKQVQCDYGNDGDETFSINDEHRLEFDDSCNFWACPVNDDDEWNIYTGPLDGQDKCVPIEIHVHHDEPKHHHHEEPKHDHDEEPEHHHHEEPKHDHDEEPKHHHHEEPKQKPEHDRDDESENDHDDEPDHYHYEQPKHHPYEQPEHNRPEKPEHGHSEEPEDDRPEKPEHDRPEKPEHDRPEKPEHDRPEKPEHSRPEKPKHHLPEESEDDLPEKPEHRHPEEPEEPEHHRPAKPKHHGPGKPKHHRPEPPRTSPIPPCPGKECEKHHQEHCPGQYKCEKPDSCECHEQTSPSNCNSCKEHDHGCHLTCTVTKTEHKTKTKFATKTRHTTATATAHRHCEKKCHGDDSCLSTCTVTKTQTQTKTKCHTCHSKPTSHCGKAHGCSKRPSKRPSNRPSKGLAPRPFGSGNEYDEYNYDNYNPYWRALTPEEASNQKRDISERLTELKTNEQYRQEQRSKYDDCAKSCHGSDDEEEHCHQSCATDRCTETCGPHKEPCFDQCYPYYHHEPSWCPETKEQACPKDHDCKKCGFGNYPNYHPGPQNGYGDRDRRPSEGDRGAW